MISHSFDAIFATSTDKYNSGSIVKERMRDIGVTICLVKLARGCNKVSVLEKLESRRANKNHACVL